jgi:hypothetical protein
MTLVLALPDFGQPFVIECDARRMGSAPSSYKGSTQCHSSVDLSHHASYPWRLMSVNSLASSSLFTTGGRTFGVVASWYALIISVSSFYLTSASPPYHSITGWANYSTSTSWWSTRPVAPTWWPMLFPGTTQMNRRSSPSPAQASTSLTASASPTPSPRLWRRSRRSSQQASDLAPGRSTMALWHSTTTSTFLLRRHSSTSSSPPCTMTATKASNVLCIVYAVTFTPPTSGERSRTTYVPVPHTNATSQTIYTWPACSCLCPCAQRSGRTLGLISSRRFHA